MDPDTVYRKALTRVLNEEAQEISEQDLRDKYGQLWDTQQLQQDFTVKGFLAPYVSVTRKADGVEGTLLFSHRPRWYYSFKETAK